MKKSELKQLFKPLIKECLNEILIEEGLKKVVEETIKKPKEIVEKVSFENSEKQLIASKIDEKKQRLEELKKKYSNAAFNPFAGTDSPSEDDYLVGEDEIEPLAHPNLAGNRGVDVSSLFSQNKGVWSAMMNASKGKKE
jgi:hypothetical protein